MLQKFCVHQFGTIFVLDQQNSLDDIVMSKESKYWCFFVDVPYDDRLIIWAADEGLSIFRNGYSPDPVLMAGKGAFAVACADFPLFYDFVSGAGEEHVACGVK